jgi:exodeoxyribonuclease-3
MTPISPCRRWSQAATASLTPDRRRTTVLRCSRVHDPRLWNGRVLFSKPERTAFRALLDSGMQDSFRLFDQPQRSYSWWDYRMNAFKRNLGLRIDHVLLSEALAANATGSRIAAQLRALERPSDHAPVITEVK